MDKGVEEPKHEDIAVIRKYPKVFLEDLPEYLLNDKSNFASIDSRRRVCGKCTLETCTFGNARIDSVVSVVDREGR